jgi:branched-subunit amino acid ABC-type transport system permease component
MDQVLASLMDGLLLGFVYGMAAMGLSLIWGVMRVINLCHGAMMTLGMFATYLLFTTLGANPYLALLVVAVLGLGFGFVVYGVAVHHVINAPPLSSLLATFSINMIIIGVGTAAFTTSPRNIDFAMGSVQMGPLTLQGTRLIAALVTGLVTAALYLFLYRTYPGKSIRAVANNRDSAELMGIPSARVLALSFGIGTMLATLAGGLIATFFPFTILSGDAYQPRSFVICVLGGLGDPLGALIGGLILGTMEGLIPTFMPVSWVPVVEFALFVLILLVRPRGLMGARS